MRRNAIFCVVFVSATWLALIATGLIGGEGSGSKEPARKDLAGDPLPDGALERMGTLRWRHAADISFVAILPDGKSVLTAGEDHTLRLWDRESGKEIRRFTKPKGSGSAQPIDPKFGGMMVWGPGMMGNRSIVALSPDGKTLAAVEGTAIQLWEVSSGKALREIAAPQNMVGALSFTSDSKTLAGRSGDAVIYLWDPETGKEAGKVKVVANEQPGPGGVVVRLGGFMMPGGLAISPDGKNFATFEMDFTKGQPTAMIRVTDRANSKELRHFEVDANSASSLAYSPDGKILAYSNGETIRLCAADSDKELKQLKTQAGGTAPLVFSADSKVLAARSTSDGKVVLWDVEKGEKLHEIDAGTATGPGNNVGFFVLGAFGGGATPDVAFSADGKTLALAVGQVVRFYSVQTGKEVAKQDGHGGPVTDLRIASDGKTLISRGGDGTVRRWEAGTGKELSSFKAPSGTNSIAIAPDGKTVALGNQDNTIRLCDAATGKELHSANGPEGGVAVLAFAADGKTVAARGAGKNDIVLVNVETGKEAKTISVEKDAPQGPGGIVVVPGGWGMGGAGPVLAFSPDGSTLASLQAGINGFQRGPFGGPNNVEANAELFDVASGKMRKVKLPAEHAPVNAVFASDGRTLAIENSDRTVTLIEVASGTARCEIGKAQKAQVDGGQGQMWINVAGPFGFGGQAAAPKVTFAPDGRKLAIVAGNDVQIWDAATRKQLKEFKGHDGSIVSLSFAPDGKSLATGSSDTTILLWDTSELTIEKPKAVKLTADDVAKAWSALEQAQANKADEDGMQRLIAGSEQALPWLKEQLKPLTPVDAKVIDKNIADLDSDDFDVRTKATQELERLGELAVPALKKALDAKPSLETQKRIEDLLDKSVGGFVTGNQLRIARAIKVLEEINNPEARQLLEALAKGASGALQTREAQAALARMGK